MDGKWVRTMKRLRRTRTRVCSTDNRTAVGRDLAFELACSPIQITRILKLFDDGHTVPFIARYRKAETGALDESHLRLIKDRFHDLQKLAKRKGAVIDRLHAQGDMSASLSLAIDEAATLKRVEDLYRPYRKQRRSRAAIARAGGLAPLAEQLLSGKKLLSWPQWKVDTFSKHRCKRGGLQESLVRGAQDIIAQQVADDPENREWVRRFIRFKGVLHSRSVRGDGRASDPPYHCFQSRIQHLRPHQILAINRGEMTGALKATINIDHSAMLSRLKARYATPSSPWRHWVETAVHDGYHRLLLPAMKREIRRELTLKGETRAIFVFEQNMRQLLLQSPVYGTSILGVDPGFRGGCQYAVINARGEVQTVGTVFPHPPQENWEEARHQMLALVQDYEVSAIALGNGVGASETQVMIEAIIRLVPTDVGYTLVNEAGASVYSASSLAQEELGHLDVSVRGAVSIARRLQDPLSELIKMEPASLGVGLYQHAIKTKALTKAFEGIAASVVNQVGVDVNSASQSLLRYVSGLGPRVAEAIVNHRREKGAFRDRYEFLQVPGIGPKTFTQAAGFLRIKGGANPLDDTWVHPESYPLANAFLEQIGCPKTMLTATPEKVREALGKVESKAIAQTLGCKVSRIDELRKLLLTSCNDTAIQPQRSQNCVEIPKTSRVEVGAWMTGIVRNVVDFGAFVDIGLGRNALLHVSEIAQNFVKDPRQHLSAGQSIKVRITRVNDEQGHISLSMKD